jgi:hypothetical protein
METLLAAACSQQLQPVCCAAAGMQVSRQIVCFLVPLVEHLL